MYICTYEGSDGVLAPTSTLLSTRTRCTALPFARTWTNTPRFPIPIKNKTAAIVEWYTGTREQPSWSASEIDATLDTERSLRVSYLGNPVRLEYHQNARHTPWKDEVADSRGGEGGGASEEAVVAAAASGGVGATGGAGDEAGAEEAVGEEGGGGGEGGGEAEVKEAEGVRGGAEALTGMTADLLSPQGTLWR